MPMFVVATFSALSVSAAAANEISFWGTQAAGKPAFGQTMMVTGISRDDGGPVANQIVRLWFSAGTAFAMDRTRLVPIDSVGTAC